jgi:2-oxoisovalerate dehydrogenase E1 component
MINSVKKTGKVLVLTEDSLFGGLASDISAIISEECFEYLDAPVMRLGSGETPIPFATALEEGYLPKKRLKDRILQLIDY